MPYNPTIPYRPSNMSGDSIRDAWANERDRAAQLGDIYRQQFGDQASQFGNLESQYGGIAGGLYEPIWQGGGGYTPEQMSNILQQGELEGLQPTGADYQRGFLTGDEWSGIAGDPYAASAYFNPGESEGRLNDAANWARGEYRAGAGAMRGAVEGMRGAYGAAIDPSRLSLSQDYVKGANTALDQTEGGIRGLYGDPSLNVSGDYMNRGALTDQEVAQMTGQAGADVGAQYGRAIDDLHRRALAAGMNPLGASSMEGELMRDMRGQSADAMTRARLAARQAQIDSLANQEKTRLGASQYRAGLGTESEQELAARRLGVFTGAEQMRMGGEQDIASRQMEAARNVGSAGLGAEQYLTGAGTGLEQDIGAANVDLSKFNQQFGAGLAGAREQAQSDRALALAQNRQAAEQAGQANRFNRGMATNEALSNRYQTAYNPWVAAQTEGRQAAQNLMGYYGGRGQQSQENTLSAWDLSQRGTQGATQGGASYDIQRRSSPSWYSRNIAPVVQTGLSYGTAKTGGKGW